MTERKLIFIGGATAAGKTTTGKALADELQAGWLQIDTIWLALKAAFPEGSAERQLLALDQADVMFSMPAEALAEQHRRASSFICGTLEAPIAHLVRAHGVVVVDGAWLLPTWVAGVRMPGVDMRAVFLHEPEAPQITAAMKERRGVAETLPFQRVNSAAAWITGNRLADEARALGIPVVEARPRETLLARVQTALSF